MPFAYRQTTLSSPREEEGRTGSCSPAPAATGRGARERGEIGRADLCHLLGCKNTGASSLRGEVSSDQQCCRAFKRPPQGSTQGGAEPTCHGRLLPRAATSLFTVYSEGCVGPASLSSPPVFLFPPAFNHSACQPMTPPSIADQPSSRQQGAPVGGPEFEPILDFILIWA